MSSAPQNEVILIALKRVDAVPDKPSDLLLGIADATGGTGIAGPFVTVKVSYSGGEVEHDFFACWDGSLLKSFPPGVPIRLLHDNKGDAAKGIMDRTLQINLHEAVGSGATYVVIEADGHEAVTATVEL